MLTWALRIIHRRNYYSNASNFNWNPWRIRSASVLITGPGRSIFTPSQSKSSEIPMERYHKISDVTMDLLLESLEALLDSESTKKYEVEYSSGVLTLNLAEKGTYVVNKQPPNKQIWLSSPISGPKRYDYSALDDGWYYARDGKSIGSLLEEELSQIFKNNVKLPLNKISEKVV